MAKTSLWRSLGALVTAGAVLLVMAAPASAATINVGLISGTIVVTKTGLTTQTIAIGGGGLCPSGALQADVTSTTSGTVRVTAFFDQGPFTWSGSTYNITITLGTTGAVTGTYDHSTGAMSGLKVPLRMMLSTVSPTTSCTPSTVLCTWYTLVTLVSSNFTSHSSSSTATLTGSGTNLALGGGCNAPFATYTTGGVAVTALNLHTS